jgi:hypothetical protein
MKRSGCDIRATLTPINRDLTVEKSTQKPSCFGLFASTERANKIIIFEGAMLQDAGGGSEDKRSNGCRRPIIEICCPYQIIYFFNAYTKAITLSPLTIIKKYDAASALFNPPDD